MSRPTSSMAYSKLFLGTLLLPGRRLFERSPTYNPGTGGSDGGDVGRRLGRPYGQLIGAVDTTNVGRLAVLFAISVPGRAVWPAAVTASAALVPDVSSNFQ